MPTRREFEAGPLLAAAGGLVLIVSLFLDWFEGEREDFSAWTSFEALDLVLAALALAALAAVVWPRDTPPRAVPVIGVTTFVIVASQLINHPPVGLERGTEFGAWMGFAGSLAMLLGGVISVARVSLAVNVTERPAPPAPPGPAPSYPAAADPHDTTPPHGDPIPPPAPPAPDDRTEPLPPR